MTASPATARIDSGLAGTTAASGRSHEGAEVGVAPGEGQDASPAAALKVGEARKRWSVVVPTIRPDRLATFREAWQYLFTLHEVDLIVVHDQPPWRGIPAFIPRRTDMIRSWGFYRAWKSRSEFTLSLDDDVLPVGDIFEAYERGFADAFPLAPYLSVGSLTDSGHEMRGFPYEPRASRVGFQYGGWDNVLDYDAVTQIAHRPPPARFARVRVPVPYGCAATCCAMNFCFRTELAPLAWQLTLHDRDHTVFDRRFNRMGDIWGGLFQKRALDAAGLVMLLNGDATVSHDRASDPWQNLRREAPGMALNERLWDALGVYPSYSDPVAAYIDVTADAADFFASEDAEYATAFAADRVTWLALFGATE